MTFIRQALSAMKPSHRSKVRIEFVFNFINRFNVVLVNILVVLTLGYTLINFGVFTLHLADIPQSVKDATYKTTGEHIGNYNLHSENFIAFIAIIAVVFATLLVVIGMVNIFVSDSSQNNEILSEEKSNENIEDYELNYKKKNKQKWRIKRKGVKHE